MDILGSILSDMDKQAPRKTISEAEKNRRKQMQERMEKELKEEKIYIRNFRHETEQKLTTFGNDPTLKQQSFPPMDSVYRSIVHDAAETAGFRTHCFGVEGLDRHVIIFKRESAPDERELDEMKRTEIYDLQKIRNLLKKRDEEWAQEDNRRRLPSMKTKKLKPVNDYSVKYRQKFNIDTAVRTTANRQYGYVPSENKKDHRSIEQTLNDLRAKKQRLSVASTEVSADK